VPERVHCVEPSLLKRKDKGHDLRS
jgi:hypothetical protein